MQPLGDILYVILLIGVVTGTLGVTLYTTISVSNALRLKNVRASWRHGRLWGYPATPFLILVAAVVSWGSVFTMGFSEYYVVASCFVWIGVNWFLASLLTSRRYITDHGIVSDVNNSSETVAWHQILDYAEDTHPGVPEYLFLYRVESDGCRSSILYKKMKLEVPCGEIENFRKIVSYKLGKSVNLPSWGAVNVKAIE